MTTEHSPQLTLFRGFPSPGRYTVSPFVTKLEFRLRHAHLKHNIRGGGPREAPMGKIPYVDLSPVLQPPLATIEGKPTTLMGDSMLIT